MGGGNISERAIEAANFIPNQIRNMCSSPEEKQNRALERACLKLLQVACAISIFIAGYVLCLKPTMPLFLKTLLRIGILHDIGQMAQNRIQMIDQAATEALVSLTYDTLRDQLLKNTLIFEPVARKIQQIIN